MDRQVLSILAPTLQRELSWSESQYAAVVYSFTLVYAFGFLVAGRWLDRVGVRRGFAVAVVAWGGPGVRAPVPPPPAGLFPPPPPPRLGGGPQLPRARQNGGGVVSKAEPGPGRRG